ncbi:hypothetical protein [Uliginosibacterium gangwonense]|uniref:hypothetical protein n=1 Tax=Uliginosibacterium gangwonense TaxID=392736 RepID=UPI0012FAC9AB|nr:hypothetical protein [Uliginosibacterium gangwonense]
MNVRDADFKAISTQPAWVKLSGGGFSKRLEAAGQKTTRAEAAKLSVVTPLSAFWRICEK